MANITSWTDLAAMSVDMEEDYVLTVDLSSADDDYEEIGDDWTPLGEYAAWFNGGGHSISDLIINVNQTNAALFSSAWDAEIENVTFINPSVTNVGASAFYAAVLCCTFGNSIATNCHVVGGSVEGRYYAGGLFSQLGCEDPYEMTISKCSSGADILSGVYAGGLFCDSSGDMGVINIINCFATGCSRITGDVGNNYGGGFAANVTGPVYYNIDNCYASGTVTSTVAESVIGGFIASGPSWTSTIDNCFFGGTLTPHASGYAGGFMGIKGGGTTVSNCGWVTDSVHNGIYSPSGSVTYEEVASYFYNKNNAIFSTWDFTTPIWYEHAADYPDFEAPAPTGWTHKINGVAAANMAKVDGVAKADIAKVMGV